MDAETAEYVESCRELMPTEPPDGDVAFGFDGVVDRVRTVVAERTGPDEYARMDRLDALGRRIRDSAAVDSSCSVEWFSEGERAGGHAAHLGRALGELGYEPTLVGAFGTPPADVFERELAASTLVSVAPHATTDAVEFDDGKLLLSDTGRLSALDWERLESTIGVESLADVLDGTTVAGFGYLSTLPRLPSILDGLREEVWPTLSSPPERVVFDPADVRRLPAERVRAGVEAVGRLAEFVPVTASANRAEAEAIASLLGAETLEAGDDASAEPKEALRSLAGAVREAVGVDRFVAHSPAAAAAAEEGVPAVAVPHCSSPELTTSAGDHFNAGLVLAELVGLDAGESLVLGAAVAGRFVRDGRPPTYGAVREFVDGYGTRFEEGD